MRFAPRNGLGQMGDGDRVIRLGSIEMISLCREKVLFQLERESPNPVEIPPHSKASLVAQKIKLNQILTEYTESITWQ
jgi:hypothetical protein